jgi:glycosyltransferase involved in cell wall biosynthesis
MTRLAILPDFAEEHWPSMDLCAEMLEAQSDGAVRLAPRFCWIFSRFCNRRSALNADRMLNRFLFYPQFVRRRRSQFDCFHIVDHTYAQLVHALPAERTGVYCHDLDAFRCLLDPKRDPRPKWFRALARRILKGLQKAAIVFHSTRAVRAEIERLGLIDPDRLIHAPYGVSPEFAAEGPAETNLGRYILHVGSNVPRKRIDILLRALAGARRLFSDLRLVKVGPAFSAEQQAIIDQWKLNDAIVRREGLGRAEIAALYRSAAVVLLPSDAEGFGLPVIEALACGVPVLASDLATLREVGGAVVEFIAEGDVDAWIAATVRAVQQSYEPWAREARLRQARSFSWADHARIIFDAYERLGVRRPGT